MAKKRSPEQRLIDNLQRKIRHLRTKENQAKASGDKFDEAGYRRNQENIQKMIDNIRKDKKTGKLDNGKLLDYAEKAKNNPNYSADRKKIRKVTKDLIFAESFFDDEDEDDYFEDFLRDEDIESILADYSELSMNYIGASADGEKTDEAKNLLDKIDEIMERNGDDMFPHQVEALNNIAEAIESALQSRGKSGVLFPLD